MARLLAQGRSQARIAEVLGVTKSTVACHVRRAGTPADQRFNRRYDWAAVQAYYDAGHGKAACMREFGFASETWRAAVRRGVLRPRARARANCHSQTDTWGGRNRRRGDGLARRGAGGLEPAARRGGRPAGPGRSDE